jgi:hypothetical protein
VEARAEQNLGLADALKGSHDVQREGHDTIVVRVCQITFRLGPDEFVGIEFGRVAGEAMDLHAGIPLEKYLDVVMSMDLSAIPEQHDRAARVTEQVPEKRDDFGPRDVAQVQVEVQPEAVTLRGHGERRDDRDFLMPITMSKTRSLPDGRPGLADVGDEQKPALIEEREMSTSACGVFLTGAIPPASTGRWLLRRARWRAVPAFANSSRGRAAPAPRRQRGCSGRRTACE